MLSIQAACSAVSISLLPRIRLGCQSSAVLPALFDSGVLLVHFSSSEFMSVLLFPFYHVPPLNRFTVEEAEGGVLNVTAEGGGKKLARLRAGLHFGELNQLNGCVRAGGGARCGWRALGKTPQFLFPVLNPFFFFVLVFRRALNSLCSRFSLLTAPLSRFSAFSFPHASIQFFFY